MGVNIELKNAAPLEQKQIDVQGHGKNTWHANAINQHRIQIFPRAEVAFVFGHQTSQQRDERQHREISQQPFGFAAELVYELLESHGGRVKGEGSKP